MVQRRIYNKIILSGISMILLFSTAALAQVVTPSMNPTTPVYMSAAAGWRTTPSVGLNYFDRIGTRAYNDQNIYEFSSSGYSASLGFNMGERLAFSASYAAETTNVEKDVYYDGIINLEKSDSQANITLAHEGFAVFGLGMRTFVSKDHLFPIDREQSITQTGTIPSMSIKIGSVIYVGGGVEIVKETGTHTVNNHWINTIFGLGIMTEKSDGFQFRVEGSATNSPEATATAKQGLDASEHSKSTITRGAVEMQYKGLVFEAFTITKNEKLINSIFDAPTNKLLTEINSASTQFGFLIAPDDGVVLGFHFRSDKTEHIYTDRNDSFVISLAYNFGGV